MGSEPMLRNLSKLTLFIGSQSEKRKPLVVHKPAELFLSELPDNHIDLVVTSPPYDGLRAYNGFSFDFETIARELFRTLKPGGIVVWVVGDQTKNGSESGTSFRQALGMIGVGFRLHDTMIYKKKNYVPLNHNRYEQLFEYMFVFSKGSPKTFIPILIPCKTAGNSSELQRKGYGFKEGSFRRRTAEIKVKATKRHGNIFEYGDRKFRHESPGGIP